MYGYDEDILILLSEYDTYSTYLVSSLFVVTRWRG